MCDLATFCPPFGNMQYLSEPRTASLGLSPKNATEALPLPNTHGSNASFEHGTFQPVWSAFAELARISLRSTWCAKSTKQAAQKSEPLTRMWVPLARAAGNHPSTIVTFGSEKPSKKLELIPTPK